MGELVGVEELEFKWGKKRRRGGKKKDVQFYESFTYDGEEYHLYDCVFVSDARQPDSSESFVGMIIKIWEHTNEREKIPRKVKLLWFFRPSEISPYIEGGMDILANELFLASGEGVGLANINQLEAICGKCSVLCISKDKRNRQPSDEEIKSSNFVFRRTFDVGKCKISDEIDDTIAGIDVKCIFNRTSVQKETSAVQEDVVAEMNGNPDSLEPNGPSANGLLRNFKDNSIKSSGCKENGHGGKNIKENEGHNQLAIKTSTFFEERSNKDSGVHEGRTHIQHGSSKASGSRGKHCDGKPQESEVNKQLTNQKSMPSEGRYINTCEGSGSRGIHIGANKAQANDVQKQLTKQKSMPAEERNCKDSNGLDYRPEKKRKLDGSVTVPNGQNMTNLKKPNSDGNNGTESNKIPGDEIVTEKPSCSNRKQDLLVPVSERKYTKTSTEKGTESIKISRDKRTRDEILTEMPSSSNKKQDIRVPVSESKYTKTATEEVTESITTPRHKVTRDEILTEKPSSSNKKQDLLVPVSERKYTKTATEKGTESFKIPRDKVIRDEVLTEKPSSSNKKQDLLVPVSERKYKETATEKGLFKKPNVDGKLLKRAEDKVLAKDDYKRNYQVIEVSRRPDCENSKWFRNPPWEESMRDAEKQGSLVLLQNLDPTYTSNEVQDIVYSALNEHCTARMIERTPYTIPHIGQALVIFKTKEAAERALRRLDDGCLLLSNGRPLVATFAKINPSRKPSSFFGHIKPKIQTRRPMRDAVATSHCAQSNTIEYEMSMEWYLHQARCNRANERIFKIQEEEKKPLRISFNPNHP